MTARLAIAVCVSATWWGTLTHAAEQTATEWMSTCMADSTRPKQAAELHMSVDRLCRILGAMRQRGSAPAQTLGMMMDVERLVKGFK